jgi:PKD repeat protein
MIKSIITTTITPVCPFPKLMISKEPASGYEPLIVLFKRESEGTVLTRTTDWSIGDRDTDFAMQHFTDFHGTIQLENGA